jgi:hypothetical protein
MHTEEEKKKILDKHLGDIYPQLRINMDKICGHNKHLWADDLLVVGLEYYLAKPLEQRWETYLNNKTENFITYICTIQVKSGNSKFYNTYRKDSINSREIFDNYKYVKEEDIEQEYGLVIQCMKKELDKLNPYEKMLIEEKIIQGKSYAFINQKYNIHNGHLLRDIKRIVKQIRTRCQHCFDL